MEALIEVKKTFSKLTKTVEFTLFINNVPIQKFSKREKSEVEKEKYENNKSKLTWVLNTIYKNDERVSIFFKNNEILEDRFEVWLKNKNQSNIDKATLLEIYDAMDDCDK